MIHGKYLKRAELPGLDRKNYLSILRIGSELDIYSRKVSKKTIKMIDSFYYLW